MLAIVVAVVGGAMAVAGAVFALTRSDTVDTVTSDTVTADSVSTEVTLDSTVAPDTEPPATEPPATETDVDVPVSDPPATDAPATSNPDPGDELTTMNDLLTWTSFAEDPLDEPAQQAEIDRLIAERTVAAVAHPTRVSTICAGIPVDAAIDLSITWQYSGETVQSDPAAATPPGVGACLDNDGEPLAAGSYQVFASNSDLSEIGFATTFVVGADGITQTFLNNTESGICEVGVAPIDTAYYEFFIVDGGTLAPGELLNIPIATVEQDLAARFCDGTEVGALVFSPSVFDAQNLAP